MASTTQDDGFHEIQLNGKQLVFLFMAATVVTVVIFLCGVLVGRGVRLERGGVVAAAPSETTEGAPPPIATDPASSNQPTAGQGELVYPGQLGGSAPPDEKLAAIEAPEARTEAVAEPPASAPAVAPPPANPSPPAASPAAALAAPAGSGIEIQVLAHRDRQNAEALARRLVGKGYTAYVVEPVAGAPALFRVRVGKFGEKREADQVAARLKKEEKLDPWIVR
ncbi:MAG: SPOR domain-containing protein [Acidobacteriota bacterium]|nr:SPOR domain-containing protein [Acidobacteriota bacterium]